MTKRSILSVILPGTVLLATGLVSTDALAAPVWGEFKADHCVDAMHRQYSAILWDIPWGESWEAHCASTPAAINGFWFAAPDNCVNTGFNMWGEFWVEDPSCNAAVEQPLNLALAGVASQSSTAYGGDASRAIDGDTNGDWFAGSVNHTAGGPSWWQVDLGSVEPVGEIVIHNRTDCCKQLLHDFEVRVSADGVNWETFSRPGLARDVNHVLVDRQVRYVRVENPEVLHVAEVEVFGTRNIAYAKPTAQSSSAFGGDPGRAVDGNSDGEYGHGSVSHTDYGFEQWWQVDLESMRRLGHVVIHNRTDCCAEQLNNFVVSVSNNGYAWEDVAFVEVAQPKMIVPLNVSARFVRVTNGMGYLHLAEVQVFEAPLLPLAPSYGRGVGTIPNPGCGPGQVIDAGLCYGQCDPGYHGVGPVCWRDDITLESIAAATCDVMRVPLFSQLAEELDVALTAGVGLGVELGVTATAEIGVAYGADGEFGCYVSGCLGMDGSLALNAYGVLGLFDTFESIAGPSFVDAANLSLNIPAMFNIPYVPIAIGGSLGLVSGMMGPVGVTVSASIGLSQPSPIDLAVTEMQCETAMLETQQ